MQCSTEQERLKTLKFFSAVFFWQKNLPFVLGHSNLLSFFFFFTNFCLRISSFICYLLSFSSLHSLLLSSFFVTLSFSNQIILVTTWSHQIWHCLYYIRVCISLPLMCVCQCVFGRREIGLWLDLVLEIPLYVTATLSLWENLRHISCCWFKPYIANILRNVQKLETRKEDWGSIRT
jgi:hypothetical protein